MRRKKICLYALSLMVFAFLLVSFNGEKEMKEQTNIQLAKVFISEETNDTVNYWFYLPVWVFHGAKDNVVPHERSIEMIEALKKAGKEVKFTLYPDANHDSWTKTYDNPELYEWFLKNVNECVKNND